MPFPSRMVSSVPPRPPAGPVRIELLTLGDELLLGLTTNRHLGFIGAELGRRGASLQRNITVEDNHDAIVRQLSDSWANSDVVITTGGLGPTCDDRTREAAAELLGRKLVFEPSIERAIHDRFALYGRKPTPNNLKQAYVVEGAEVLRNPNGTAPGLWLEQAGRILCLLPGPTNEMQPMFLEQVLPRLVSRGLIREEAAYLQLRTAGIGESALETLLQPVFDRVGPGLQVAFCAHEGLVDVRLGSPGGDLDAISVENVAAECVRLMGEDFVCRGHDSLPKVCADLLRAADRSLAVAEAATGGLLANAFSGVCGACKCLAGGVVCPTNAAAVQLLNVPECLLAQHGSASAENAVAMATGVSELLGADYALAVTGFSGPSGSPGENPIGSIYIALASPEGVWSRKLSYPGPRCTVRHRAVNAALDWLRRELIRARTTRPVPGAALRVLQ